MATRTLSQRSYLLISQVPLAKYTSYCIRPIVVLPKLRHAQTFIRTQQSQIRLYCVKAETNIAIADYTEIKELTKKANKLLIDVREPSELKKTGQIPTSINIPLGIVKQELDPSVKGSVFKSKYGRDKPTPDTEIIFHCQIGKRSMKAAEAAAALGYKNLKNYEGSWLDWAEREGLPK